MERQRLVARPRATTPSSAFGEWNLATDPVSGQALLLADQSRFVAEPDAPVAQPAIACPMQTTAPTARPQPTCPVFPISAEAELDVDRPRVEGDEAAEHHRVGVRSGRLGRSSMRSAGSLAIFGGELHPADAADVPDAA